jgi:hypothetical protein
MNDTEYIAYLQEEVKAAEAQNMTLTQEFQRALAEKEVRSAVLPMRECTIPIILRIHYCVIRKKFWHCGMECRYRHRLRGILTPTQITNAKNYNGRWYVVV